MIRLRHKLLIQAFRLYDQATLLLCGVAVFFVIPSLDDPDGFNKLLNQSYQLSDLIALALLILGWNLAFNHFVRYNANRFTSVTAQSLDVLKSTTTCAVLLFVVGAALSISRISRLEVLLFWCLVSALGVVSRLVIRWLLIRLRMSGYNSRHLLVVGWNSAAWKLVSRIETSPELGYQIMGFIAEQPNPNPPPVAAAMPTSRWKVVGCLSDLKGILEHGTVDELMICMPIDSRFGSVAEIIRLGQQLGVVVRLVPEPDDAKLLQTAQMEVYEGDHVVTFFRERSVLQLLVKRLIDMIASSILLFILSPLLLAVAIAIKYTSPGPVFFVQERVGMNKRRFKLYKFRSMVADAEQRRSEVTHLNEMDGPVFKVRNDPRITQVGKIIRKTSIDELPQLFNVLQGQMSLVGPRPPLPAEVDKYDWLYRRRLSIKPGITCLWQVSGRNEISFKEWMELDRAYIDNWSLWLDLTILLKTIPVILLGRGAS